MTYKDFFKENNMSQIPIGGQSTLTGQHGTYASPDVTQNPGSFPADSSKVNIVSPVNQDVKSKMDPEQYKKDVDTIKYKVTPDDIIQGIEYELKKQIYKNKTVAKETVVTNLKKNPRYYRDLDMLTGGPEMVSETTVVQSQEIKKILHNMALQPAVRSRIRVDLKYGNFDAIKKLMDEKWEEKQNKRKNNG